MPVVKTHYIQPRKNVDQRWKELDSPHKGIMVFDQSKTAITYARFCKEELPEDAKAEGFDEHIKVNTYYFDTKFNPIISDVYTSGGYDIKSEAYPAREDLEVFCKVLFKFLEMDPGEDLYAVILGIYTGEEKEEK